MIDKYRLEIVLLVSGAVVMILGLISSRIAAPFLGTSVHVWAILIGIILASLSIGCGVGGSLADRKPHPRAFAQLILLAAVLIGAAGLVKDPVLGQIQHWRTDVRFGAAAAAAILFAPAGVVLGMISPYAVRLKLRTVAHAGATVGRLYAVSVAGGIAGTVFSAFVLLPALGNANLLRLLSLVLLFTSMAASGEKSTRIQKAAGTVLVLCLIWSWWLDGVNQRPRIVDADTRYHRVIVGEKFDKSANRFIRTLRVNRDWGQSAVVVGQPETLFCRYNRFFRLADHFAPDNRRALLIGGGVGTFARDYLDRHPRGLIDVVEVDPAIIRLAKSYFYLTADRRMEIYYEDGRTFINRTKTKYDVIFLDVFSTAASPPFHLLTREALQAMADRLNPGGLVMANLFSAIEGTTGRFFRAALPAFKKAFAHVAVFPVLHPKEGGRVQNLVIAALPGKDAPAFKSADPELNGYLAHRWTREIPADVPMLTDDFAPAAQYLAPVLTKRQ
jgi:spermidine synthase